MSTGELGMVQNNPVCISVQGAAPKLRSILPKPSVLTSVVIPGSLNNSVKCSTTADDPDVIVLDTSPPPTPPKVNQIDSAKISKPDPAVKNAPLLHKSVSADRTSTTIHKPKSFLSRSSGGSVTVVVSASPSTTTANSIVAGNSQASAKRNDRPSDKVPLPANSQKLDQTRSVQIMPTLRSLSTVPQRRILPKPGPVVHSISVSATASQVPVKSNVNPSAKHFTSFPQENAKQVHSITVSAPASQVSVGSNKTSPAKPSTSVQPEKVKQVPTKPISLTDILSKLPKIAPLTSGSRDWDGKSLPVVKANQNFFVQHQNGKRMVHYGIDKSKPAGIVGKGGDSEDDCVIINHLAQNKDVASNSVDSEEEKTSNPLPSKSVSSEESSDNRILEILETFNTISKSENSTNESVSVNSDLSVENQRTTVISSGGFLQMDMINLNELSFENLNYLATHVDKSILEPLSIDEITHKALSEWIDVADSIGTEKAAADPIKEVADFVDLTLDSEYSVTGLGSSVAELDSSYSNCANPPVVVSTSSEIVNQELKETSKKPLILVLSKKTTGSSGKKDCSWKLLPKNGSVKCQKNTKHEFMESLSLFSKGNVNKKLKKHKYADVLTVLKDRVMSDYLKNNKVPLKKVVGMYRYLFKKGHLKHGKLTYACEVFRNLRSRGPTRSLVPTTLGSRRGSVLASLYKPKTPSLISPLTTRKTNFLALPKEVTEESTPTPEPCASLNTECVPETQTIPESKQQEDCCTEPSSATHKLPESFIVLQKAEDVSLLRKLHKELKILFKQDNMLHVPNYFYLDIKKYSCSRCSYQCLNSFCMRRHFSCEHPYDKLSYRTYSRKTKVFKGKKPKLQTSGSQL